MISAILCLFVLSCDFFTNGTPNGDDHDAEAETYTFVVVFPNETCLGYNYDSTTDTYVAELLNAIPLKSAIEKGAIHIQSIEYGDGFFDNIDLTFVIKNIGPEKIVHIDFVSQFNYPDHTQYADFYLSDDILLDQTSIETCETYKVQPTSITFIELTLWRYLDGVTSYYNVLNLGEHYTYVLPVP